MMTTRKQRRSSPTVANEQSLVPLLPRSLRSRKRECPDETFALSDNNQRRVTRQVTKRDDETQAVMPREIPQQPLQGCTETSTQFEQTGNKSIHSMQESSAKESYSEPLGTFTKERIDGAVVMHGDTAENLSIPSSSVHNQKDEEDLNAKNYNNMPSSTDQPLPPMAAHREGELMSGGGGVTTAEEELSQAKNLDRQMEYSQEDANLVCAVDDTEAVNGFPVKKRRRMGMCGLTGKERSHFLQAQQRDTGKHVTEGVHELVSGGGGSGESPIIDDKEFDMTPAKQIIPLIFPSPPSPSISVESVAPQHQIEMQLQSACPGRQKSADTEIEGHSSSTASERDRSVKTPAVGERGCSEGETCQAYSNIEPSAGQGHTPDPPPESVGHHTDQQLHADSVLDVRKNQEGDQSNSLEVDSMAAPIEAASVGGSSSDNAAEVLSKYTGIGPGDCPREEHCKAAATPSGLMENGNCGSPDGNHGTVPFPVKQLQSETTHDSLGSWSLDNVTDSQLHDIVLDEEQVKRGDEGGHEDATDLVCGLIRELSSLNRTVMTAHRELENMRRGNKGSKASRSSLRRVFAAGPRHLQLLQYNSNM